MKIQEMDLTQYNKHSERIKSRGDTSSGVGYQSRKPIHDNLIPPRNSSGTATYHYSTRFRSKQYSSGPSARHRSNVDLLDSFVDYCDTLGAFSQSEIQDRLEVYNDLMD